MAEKVSWSDVLRAGAHLLEHPEDWTAFKAKFSHEACKAAVKLAQERGLPADMIAKMKRELDVE